ncbi:hypothetical protein T440DRAFT_138226 [Plenodomus tracheiphilus IPT5]|uniref:GAT domain-containing protein n=1 Tax=Plenodomus tracheiphilus IPT5 TaxID=1408161 RepID=A0A6A7B474_9PLEO|nr:hypothetical protein T440DRAFT_138226 [Plenodomus tracheiphilus IPT5]
MVELKKRLNLGSLMRKRSSQNVPIDSGADTPEANAARGVTLFCESGANNTVCCAQPTALGASTDNLQGEEVLHLPTIVEAAVASPSAAASAARQIRTFLSKENYSRPHVQYNSVMLIRILADNPGPSFTKNLDKQFADTVKHLLRNGNDPSVSQIVKETLESMEREKAYDTNLNTLFAMWRKEKGLMETAAKSFGPRKLNAPGWSNSQQIHGGFGSGSSRSKGLPPPQELVGRIEEARTSAKLLLQLVQSTPANELLGNELVKEFAERCTTAQRSVHGYIACDNPAPDDDTMLTLIETNEQLSLAASKHQRAVLQARRLIGASPSPPVQNGNNNNTNMGSAEGFAPPPHPPRPNQPSSFSPSQDAPSLPPVQVASTQPGQTATNDFADYHTSSLPPSHHAAPAQQRSNATEENPFADSNTSSYTPPPGPPPQQQDPRANGYGGSPDSYHPGYQSTPSYLGRQESSVNNLTMHGAQTTIAEEDPYPAPQRPRTPELHMPAQSQANDVSPVAERNTVTYRY